MKNPIKLKNFIFLSQRQRMSPFPNYMSMESMTKEMKKYTGHVLKEEVLFLQGNIFFAFPHKESRERVGKALVKKIFKKPDFVTQLVLKQKKLGQELVDFTKKANRVVGLMASSKRLAGFFSDYEKKYKQVYATYGWVWLTEDFFMAELFKIVEKKINNPNKAVDVLNILTQQPKAMVATIERNALLELALKIAGRKDWRQDKKTKSLIKSHVRKYFWVTRDYEDPVITDVVVINRLAELFKKNYKNEYRKLIVSLNENKKLRQKYLRELNFSQKEKKLFGAMLDIAYLKELRKANVSKSLYYFDKVLTEIGKRLYLSIRQVRFMKTSEVKEALVGGKDFTQELNDRLSLSVWDSSRAGTRVITKKLAEKLFNEFCKVDRNAKEFLGLPVSPGVARGPVRIVLNPDECDKVQNGEIIVSIQVVPSFSTAIIKSAGLVCDGGHGVTSHPATMAREAGIPCVIQTRFAREVLKDGDIVEVDGYKGIVRIIKKK